MLARVLTAANFGMEGRIIEVQCDMTSGLPGLIVVGLGNKAVAESKDRVRSAIKNSHLLIPPKRITFNLAPANLPKYGTGFDLSLAIALLVASGQLENPKDALVLGELSLDGSVRPVPGILGAIQVAKRQGLKRVLIPRDNSSEAMTDESIKVIPIETLEQAHKYLSGQLKIRRLKRSAPRRIIDTDYPDFSDIYGQDQAKRAMEIALAGGHNILLSGPPGSGKTMLSKAARGLLPDLSESERLEIAQVYSLAGRLRTANSVSRPFRSPHHTASAVSLIGGGRYPTPGEISLSHGGILFLDEFPEFPREAMEALRQPLEEKQITVSRAAGAATYPANFILVAAQNPCPCGYAGDPVHRCGCTNAQLVNYRRKISGPLLERIDLVIEVGRVDYRALTERPHGEHTRQIAERVDQARAVQKARLGTGRQNASMTNEEIKLYCKLDSQSEKIGREALINLGLSARTYLRLLKVARTVADFENANIIAASHLTETLRYRPRS